MPLNILLLVILIGLGGPDGSLSFLKSKANALFQGGSLTVAELFNSSTYDGSQPIRIVSVPVTGRYSGTFR